MRLLEGEKVSIHFGGLAALHNLDFHLEQGEVLGLIGPNGAGKTTLLNLISGSLAPTSGVIKFKGESIAGLKRHEICKRGIARTFQSVKLFGNMTVPVNVSLAAQFGRSKHIREKDARQEAMEILGFVGLSRKQAALAKDLTLTDQKRLELARTLATQPELLLLDEVMAGLNPTEVLEAIALIKEINRNGTTVLMVEHMMKAIMSISDRILVLHHGEKIAEGRPQEIIKDKKVIETYLGTDAYVDG
jgi:branched-chain amino acid transport system ATP-binding protein